MHPYHFTRSNCMPLADEPVMRVGVPHSRGRLAATVAEGHPVMVSASAFWDRQKQRFTDAWGPLSCADVALDSAGFTAVRNWQEKGQQPGMASVYPWTVEQYVDLAEDLNPSWFSAPDRCCEREVAEDAEARRMRISTTAVLLEETLRCVAERWAAGPTTLRPCTPIVQGWTVDDYRRSLDLTMEVWCKFNVLFDPPALIGIGSVCRRDLNDPKHGVFSILEGLIPHLPSRARLHLFGVKGTACARLFEYPEVASVDSMAWDVAARHRAHREGRSNTVASRLDAVSSWMANHDEGISVRQRRLAL
ncbi:MULTISPECIES: hypothetical protein [unclassified Dyella]|uniref:deazapurine DNA modification protein DpdA family protein n=1 Tax=Dyella sp. ASV21 TaxID=2795114 RepID=UPI0018EDE56A|nr:MULTISPECIES: hypothetical protein [unclassified Dyella]